MALSRPMGVTILAVLQLIKSLSVISWSVIKLSEQLSSDSTGFQNLDAELEDFLSWFGFLCLLLFEAFGLVLAWGLFRLKGWAWLITLIFQGCALFKGLILLSDLQRLYDFYNFSSGEVGGVVLETVIAAVIIYYLLRPDVKRAFGKQ